MAFPRAGRPAGHSGVWTPPVPLKSGAPHAFHGSLRAPFHARETRSTGPAGRGSGSGRAYGRRFARLDQVSRAWRRGAPGRCPPLRHQHPWGCFDLGDGLRPAGPCLAAPPGRPLVRLGRTRLRGLRAALP
jgi:hypothetical protein